jgi:predicted aspartyl protease
MPKVDAFKLGYTEAGYTEAVTRPPNLVSFATGNGLSEGPVIKIVEASVGPISLQQVDFIAFDMNQQTGCDVVLGKSFLQTLRFSIDYRNKKFSLEKEN